MKVTKILGSIMGLLLVAGTAAALPLDTTGGQLFNNILHDTSGEYLLSGTDAIINAEDVLAGDIVFDRINSVFIGGQSGYEELTAHFEAKVLSVTGNDTVGYTYTFGSNYANGAMAWFYTDTTPDATFSNSATLSNGTLWAVFGLTDADTEWTAWTKTNDIIALATLIATHPTTAAQYGTYEFYLDVIENYSGLTFMDVGVDGTQLQGNGHFQAKTNDYAAPYVLGDQADVAINVVPEPASLVLLGVGLLGGAALVTRRRKA